MNSSTILEKPLAIATMPDMRPHPLFSVVFYLFFVACTTTQKEPPEMDINLYSGIRNFVRLGIPEDVLKKNTSFPAERVEIQSRSPAASLEQVEVTHYLDFRTVGTKVYFRQDRAVLIEIQDPFKGKIQGKNLDLFQMSKPEKGSWEASLERIFGGPVARASGGSFGEECLFYPWGDISYNRNGPSQLALYRDQSISRYRQKSFGRELRLFGN